MYRQTTTSIAKLDSSVRRDIGPGSAADLLHNLLSGFIPMDLLPFSSAKSGDALARGDHEFESLLLQRGVSYELLGGW